MLDIVFRDKIPSLYQLFFLFLSPYSFWYIFLFSLPGWSDMRHGEGVGGVFGGGGRVWGCGVQGGWRGYDKLKSDRITTDRGPQKYQKNRVKKNSYRRDIVTRNTVYAALFPSPYSSDTLFRMNFGQMGRVLHSQFPLYKGPQASSFLFRLLFIYWRRRGGSRGYFFRYTDAIGMVFQITMSLLYQYFFVWSLFF